MAVGHSVNPHEVVDQGQQRLYSLYTVMAVGHFVDPYEVVDQRQQRRYSLYTRHGCKALKNQL